VWLDADVRRNAELSRALEANSKVFNEVYVWWDTRECQEKYVNPLLRALLPMGRPTVRTMLEHMRLCGPNEITVLANADIAFDSTIRLAKSHMQPGEAWALSRWERGKLYDCRGSQDAWVFNGLIPPMDDPRLDFPLGTPGIDNALVDIMRKAGLTVTNPSRTVRNWHEHASGVRNYLDATGQVKARVPPPYQFVEPTTLAADKESRSGIISLLSKTRKWLVGRHPRRETDLTRGSNLQNPAKITPNGTASRSEPSPRSGVSFSGSVE